jgi:phenylacetate-CoA ligase
MVTPVRRVCGRCGQTARHPEIRSFGMAARVARNFDGGIHRVLRLSATQPRGELVAALNEFRPDALIGYASVLALLAAQQIDGQLRIAPCIVMAAGEPRTVEMTDTIRDAWGAEPAV